MEFNSKDIKITLTFIFSIFACTSILQAQTFLYFQDSPSSDFYDYSWMDLDSPSELERKGSNLRKFPVETETAPQQGLNSLRLNWKSMEGGNWFAIAAGDNWTAKDITGTDTLVFWAQSVEGISAENLPSVFMEDTDNKKSVFISLADLSDDLVAGVWTRITVPMSEFLTSGDGVNYTIIKTIGFAQNADDGTEHTLLLDNMRVNVGDGTAPTVSPPQNVVATPYECHIEVSWEFNEENVNGYEIERSVNSGLDYSTVGQTDSDTRYFIDWVKPLGETVEAVYRVRALNTVNESSEPSDTAGATTYSMTDEELLDMVQEYTFRYFWDFGHDLSGLARERNTSGNTVTSGGSGFGIMTIPVGIERGYITREEGVERILKMLNFLDTAETFHGAWSHWLNGNTGEAKPFSTYDNGGDIVETAYMAQGLLTIRQYFDGVSEDEQQIVQLATRLWEEIDWDWYRKDGSDWIYWHWSPEYNWQMNMWVRGWNEAAIVYLLAIASPTHGVPASLWRTGWAGGNYTNGKSFYGHKLHVGKDYGGPLFFAHYSFLGFDPRHKADEFANYFEHNRNHSLVNQAYCEANPKGFTGYSGDCWGLTASDDPDGYMAHEPNSDRDNGTITPTAALSSFPYTPVASMKALKHFYRELGDKTWDWMGFYDAFNQQRDWYATSYLAIDQGPIILMIENYRSQLLWDLFMSNPEIQPMMDAIGFTYFPQSADKMHRDPEFSIAPNPTSTDFTFRFTISKQSNVNLDIYNLTGTKVHQAIARKQFSAGQHHIEVNNHGLEPGIYLIRFGLDNQINYTSKLVVQ